MNSINYFCNSKLIRSKYNICLIYEMSFLQEAMIILSFNHYFPLLIYFFYLFFLKHNHEFEEIIDNNRYKELNDRMKKSF